MDSNIISTSSHRETAFVTPAIASVIRAFFICYSTVISARIGARVVNVTAILRALPARWKKSRNIDERTIESENARATTGTCKNAKVSFRSCLP
jgi:hypothetical protein